MNPIIEQIKNLLLSSSNSPNSSTPTSPILSPTLSTSFFNTSEIYQEIENANDVFIVIEEVEISENNVSTKKNNQKNQKIDLNKPLETEGKLEKVKKDLYDAYT